MGEERNTQTECKLGKKITTVCHFEDVVITCKIYVDWICECVARPANY